MFITKPKLKGSDYGFNGPRKIGRIGRFTVFYDDKLAVDKGWMTYRGNEWYDAAYYLGVFLPIAPTDAVNINIKGKTSVRGYGSSFVPQAYRSYSFDLCSICPTRSS